MQLCCPFLNYLGLSSHPEMVKTAHEGLDSHGFGMSSVRFICGTQDIHRKLENKVTEFLGTEDTILFSSCMDANAGVFKAIIGEDADEKRSLKSAAKKRAPTSFPTQCRPWL